MSSGIPFLNTSLSPAARRTNSLALAFCTVAALAEGFDNQSMGVAAPSLMAAFVLKPAQLGYVFSAATAGLFVGALLGGRAADIWGRHGTLAASLLMFGFFSIVTAFTKDLPQLLLARFLTGLGLGSAMPNFIALAAESVGAQRRGKAVALVSAAIPLGGAVAGVFTLGAGASGDWRPIFYAGGAIPLCAGLLAALLLRGSPTLPGGGMLVKAKSRGVGQALFAGKSRTTLLLWTAFLVTHLVLFSLLNWLPSLSTSLGLPRRQIGWAATSLNIGGAIGGLLVGALDRVDRRRTILMTYLGACAAVIGLALFGRHGVLVFVVSSFLAGLFTIGAQVILYGLAPLCYPTSARGTGVGAALALGRFGAVIGPTLIGSLIAGGLCSEGALLSVLPFVVLGCGAALILDSHKPAEP